MRVLVLGCGITGLIAAHHLSAIESSIEVTIIEKKSKEDIFTLKDDIPYYFNSNIEMLDIELEQEIIKMSIWNDNCFYGESNSNFAKMYSEKIVNKNCGNTLKYLQKEKQIFLPPSKNSLTKGEFLELLYEKVKDKVKIKFESAIESVDLPTRNIKINDGTMAYDYLINTIDLPTFLELTNSSKMVTKDKLEHFPIYMALFDKVDTKYYATYCVDKSVRFSRIAQIGKTTFLESSHAFDLGSLNHNELNFVKSIDSEIVEKFGQARYQKMNPGRFISLEEDEYNRIEEFYHEKGVFLIGRYGTWTFKLTEDIWSDAMAISDLLTVRYKEGIKNVV